MAVKYKGGQSYTYEPSNFYGARGRQFSLDRVSEADRAKYRANLSQARLMLNQLITLLEGTPRVDQFEEIPDTIKKLREVRDSYLPKK